MTEDRDSRKADPVPTADEVMEHLVDRPAAFYNAILTEHFVLESARGITVSESSSRASLYLMTLSSSLVAFGFLAGTGYAQGFLAVVIPVVFLLELFTYERLVETSLEDVAALASIQRIRRLYARSLSGADKYFPIPNGLHAPNEMLPIGKRSSWRGVFFTMSSAIAVVNSIVAGAGVAIFLNPARQNGGSTITLAIVVAGVLAILHGIYQEARYGQLKRITEPSSESAGT